MAADIVTWDEVVALAGQVVRAATERDVTLACAESCTGGLVASALTSVAGSSAVFLGGVVSYDPSVKHALLGVPASVIETPGIGVVSAECAGAMAAGVVRACLTCFGVATTGIAGPTGAEPGKPIGTVYVAVARRQGGGAAVRCVRASRYGFCGDRNAVRLQATRSALEVLYGEMVDDRP